MKEPKTVKVTLAQKISRAILKLFGWTIVGNYPEIPKFVLVGAPHTTNWDFPLAMLWMYGSGVRFNWVGKDSLFKPPFGWLFYRLRGIPVKRDSSYNFVDQIIKIFKEREQLIIAITPEGTRSKSPYWKTGFYYIAQGAGVPLVLAFIDFSKKQIGIGPTIELSGDINEDFKHLRNFYVDKQGLYPDKQGLIELKPTSNTTPPRS